MQNRVAKGGDLPSAGGHEPLSTDKSMAIAAGLIGLVNTLIACRKLDPQHVEMLTEANASLVRKSTVPEFGATELISPQLAGQILGISAKTLANWRVKGTGPHHLKVGGRIRYRVSALQQWQDLSMRVSTSTVYGGQGTMEDPHV